MVRNIFKKIAQNFCIYLLTAMNLIHAIQKNTYDWLLWASAALTAISLVLCIISAVKEGKEHAQT